MRIAYDNLVDDNILTENSENANYPSENLTSTNAAKTYRSTGIASEYVRLDAGTGNTIVCSSVAIANHNFTSAVSAIVHAASTTAAISSAPTTSVTISYASGVMMLFFTENTERFWQLDLADAGNSDGYLEMGRLFLGPYLQMDPSSFIEFDMSLQRTDRTSYSITNQAFSDIGVQFWNMTYDFPWTTTTAVSNIITFYDDVGLHSTFFFTNYDSNYTSVVYPIYATLGGPIKFKHYERGFFEFSLNIREVG